jgi:hypothetical protein
MAHGLAPGRPADPAPAAGPVRACQWHGPRAFTREFDNLLSMALPGKDKTFALDNCRDLLRKLEREIKRFGQDRTDIEARIDHAFNAVVTVWHLSDWVFADMTEEQKLKLQIFSLPELKAHALQCRAIRLCRQAATASKHWEVTNFPDPNVAVIVTTKPIGDTTVPWPSIYIAPDWYLYFVDAQKTLEAEQVFEEALHFWTGFIYQNGIAA